MQRLLSEAKLAVVGSHARTEHRGQGESNANGDGKGQIAALHVWQIDIWLNLNFVINRL